MQKLISIFSFLFLTVMIMAESDQAEVEFLTRVVSDIASNGQEYLQYFRTGNQPINLGLLATAQQITAEALGDSYTTLAADLAFMSDLSAMITPLPWYSERIADELETLANNTSATTTTGSTTSTANEVGKIGVSCVGLSMIGGVLLAIL